jgi:ABC-type transport system substrate-binding protein
MKRKKMKSKGFIVVTAILAVVLLITVLLTVILPHFGGFGSADQTADAGNLEMVKEGSAKTVKKKKDRKNTLVIYADDLSGSYNPVYVQSDGDRAVSRIIYEPLMEQDADGIYQPCLASGMEVSEDGLTYTIQLKEHVLFSDGSEMTAKDVIASIAAMGFSDSAGSAEKAYGNIEGMETFATEREALPSGLTSDGDYTVKVTFTQASPDNLLILGTFVQKDQFTASDGGKQRWDRLTAETGIGTGAYTLSETITAGSTFLKVNESYREKVGDIKEIEFTPVSYYETSQKVEESGLDVVLYSGSSLLYDTFYGWDGYSVYSEPENTVYTLFYNQNNAALKNQKVRQAIACALDRERAEAQIQADTFTFQAGIGPDMQGAELSTAYSYDVEKAKELLKEAQEELPVLADGLTLNFPILKDSAVYSAFAQTLKDDLEEIGIQVEVTELDQQEYMQSLYLTMNFDLYLAGVTITDSVDSYQDLYEYNGMPVNVEDEGIEEAYDALTASASPEEVSRSRKALYDAFEEAQPSLILGRSRNYISVSADLSGYGIRSYEDFLGQIYKIQVK